MQRTTQRGADVMDLVERLRQKMKDEFGISTDEELMEAVRNHQPVDLGIFVTPYKGENDAKSA